MVIEVRLTFSLFGQVAIDVLIGEEEGDTVESCSGGLLGTQFGGEKIFLIKIPIIGISGCDFAGFLGVIVDAVDKLFNDCTECNNDDSGGGSGSFQVLEAQLQSLLQGAYI